MDPCDSKQSANGAKKTGRARMVAIDPSARLGSGLRRHVYISGVFGGFWTDNSFVELS